MKDCVETFLGFGADLIFVVSHKNRFADFGAEYPAFLEGFQYLIFGLALKLNTLCHRQAPKSLMDLALHHIADYYQVRSSVNYR